MNAADRLRQAIEALPEHVQQPWLAYSDQVYVEHNGNDHVFAWTDTNRSRGPAGNAEAAAYIALMDPTVGAALADLLDAIQAEHDRAHPADCEVWPVCAAAHALEQAIERSQT